MQIWKGVLVLTSGLVALSCSSADTPAPNPVAPSETVAPAASVPEPQVSPGFVPSIATDDVIAGFGAFATIGGTIDPETLEVRLDEPLRSGTIGEIFDLDITDFTNEDPCPDCMQVTGFGVNASGNIELEVGLRHPFKDEVFFFTRPDLNVFDPRVTLIIGGFETAPGIRVFPDNAAVDTDLVANLGVVVNADGMTSHFDSRAEDTRYFDPPKGIQGNVNPYKRYFEDARNVQPFIPTDPEGWNVLPIASELQTQVFEINPNRLLSQDGAVPFVLVAEASWGQGRDLSLPEDDPGGRRNPVYWLPAFNQHEPWRVEVAVTGNTLEAGQAVGSLDLDIRVSDWQAGLAGDPTYPTIGNFGAVPETSDVTAVFAAAPGVNGAGVSTTDRIGGTGTATDPYVYNLSFTNADGADAGTFYGVVAAQDSLHGSSAGPQRVPELGFPRQGAEVINYAGYNTFEFTIGEINFEPSLDPATLDPANGIINAGDELCVTANILDVNPNDSHTVQWDFSYVEADGFQPEGTGLSTCFTYNDPGLFTIAAQVTDDGDPPLMGFNDNVGQVKVNGVRFPIAPFGITRLDMTPVDGGQHAVGFTNLGHLVLTWTGFSLLTGSDIFLSISQDLGSSFAAPFNITEAPGDQKNPSLSVLDRSIFVAYEDGTGISGTFSTNGGTVYEPPFQIHPNGTRPSSAVAAPNLFYVAYSNGGDVFLEVNTLAALNDFSGDPELLNDVVDGLQTRPDIVVNPTSDTVFAVWEDDRAPEFGVDIYGTRVTNRGIGVEVNRLLSTDRGPGDDTEPSLAIAPAEDTVVLGFRTEQFRGTGDIMTLRSTDGGVTWLPGAVPTSGEFGTFDSPSVALNGNNSTMMLSYTKSITDPSFATAFNYHLSGNLGATFEAPIDPMGRSFRDPNTTVAVPAAQQLPVTVLMWTDQQENEMDDFGTLVMQWGFNFTE